MLRFLKNLFGSKDRPGWPRRGSHGEKTWDEKGIRFEWRHFKGPMDAEERFIPWDSVSAIDTYKVDCFVCDSIVLALKIEDGWLTFSEDMEGWIFFIETVESVFPGFPSHEEWLPEVTFPPFETNHKRLWTRDDPTKSTKPLPA